MNELIEAKKANPTANDPPIRDIVRDIEQGKININDLPHDHKWRDVLNIMHQYNMIDGIPEHPGYAGSPQEKDDTTQNNVSQSPVGGIKNHAALTNFLINNPEVTNMLRDAGAVHEDDEPKKKKADEPRSSQTQFKEPESDEIDWGSMFDEPESKPIARVEPPKSKDDFKAAPETPTLRKASAATTARATANITPTDQMRDMLSRINVPDDAMANEPEMPGDVDHEVAVPEPPPPSGVPARISTAIAASDPSAINPEWHQIKNLPGYMQRPIRAMGRASLGEFTDTPIEEISLIANLGGQGPNSDREVNGVASWLRANGKKIDSANMDFGATIPGYEAQTQVYATAGMRFLVVRDFAGGYIYAWPDTTNDQIAGGSKPKLRLR